MTKGLYHVIEVLPVADEAANVVEVVQTKSAAIRLVQQLSRKFPINLYCFLLVIVEDSEAAEEEVSHG